MTTREEWKKKIEATYKDNDVGKAILEDGKEGAKVGLVFGHETGEWMWSLYSMRDKELWLESLFDYDVVLSFCKSMGWDIVESGVEGGWEGAPEYAVAPICPYCGTSNTQAKGTLTCRACTKTFESFEIPAEVVYCTRK